MDNKKAIAIFSFTRTANELNVRVREELSGRGYICEGYTAARLAGSAGLKALGIDTKAWIGQQWGKKDFLFIGAAGIAVRYIAPWVRDKYTDSAVLVMDEKGEYIIPLLSGHMGGAVEIARTVAAAVHVAAVLTTATDVQGRFAVDVFARDNHLRLTDRKLVTRITAAVLEGESVGFYSELPDVDVPEKSGLIRCGSFGGLADHAYGIAVMAAKKEDRSAREAEQAGVLVLEPFADCKVVAGIGCRKGTPMGQIKAALVEVLAEQGLGTGDVTGLASIDLKKEETGICELAEELGVPFHTFPASELREVSGKMEGSDFVSKVTGVDNVCERAVRRCSPGGRVLQPKRIVDGITLALVEAIAGERPRVLLFGGTTESIALFQFLQGFDLDVILSVATEYGMESAKEREAAKEDGRMRIICGRMDREEILAFVEKNDVELVIDATHPFAREVTANIRWACRRSSAEYIRCLREETDPPRETAGQAVYVDSVEEAVEYLKSVKGNILITTGSKELGKFCELPDYRTRCYARILSVTDSVRAGAECGFVGKNLIAMQGPFSEEMNIAMIHYADASFLVTKESGDAGGMREKAEACRKTGTTLVAVRRPDETGGSVKAVCAYINQKYQEYKQSKRKRAAGES